MVKRNLLAAVLALGLGAAVHAQPKTTRIVVSFTSGGPVDSVARTLSEQLGKELGRTVIIDNKPGANGAIGAVDVMKSAPDGGTLWFTSVGAAAINASLYEKLPYDMQRDFAPVSLVVNNVELLVAQQGNPARDAAEFVAATKKKADPTPMGSSGTGSIPHLPSNNWPTRRVPSCSTFLQGAAPAITDLMGGQISGFFGDVPGLLGHLQGGRLKALGVASSKRHPSLPDVKTLEEQGIRGVDTNNWYALFAPAKTPPEVIAALNKAVRNTLANPAVREKLLKTGTEPAGSTPQELAAIQKQDTEKWAKLVRAKNIKAE